MCSSSLWSSSVLKQTVLGPICQGVKDTIFCRGYGGCPNGGTGQCGWVSSTQRLVMCCQVLGRLRHPGMGGSIVAGNLSHYGIRSCSTALSSICNTPSVAPALGPHLPLPNGGYTVCVTPTLVSMVLHWGAKPPLAPCVTFCISIGASCGILVSITFSLRPDEAMLFVMVTTCLFL